MGWVLTQRVLFLCYGRIGFWSVGFAAWLSEAKTHAKGGLDAERIQLKDRMDPFNTFNNVGGPLKNDDELRMPRMPQIFSLDEAIDSSDGT